MNATTNRTSSANDAYLTIHHDARTGLVHGALYRNKPTPSGCDRYLLSVTTTEGYRSEIEAAEAINAGFPDLPPVSLENLVDLGAVMDAIPNGATVVHIHPKDGSAAWVEVRPRGWSPFGTSQTIELPDLTPLTMQKLSAIGFLEIDSSSGNDPGLSCIYDYHVVRRSPAATKRPAAA